MKEIVRLVTELKYNFYLRSKGTGKKYGGGGTEIISMGLEQLWDNPSKFAKEDPEYFNFMLVTLENARI